MSTTNGKSHGNNYILPVVDWIFVMIWYIMDVKNKTFFFDNFNFNERLLNSVTDSQIFKMK